MGNSYRKLRRGGGDFAGGGCDIHAAATGSAAVSVDAGGVGEGDYGDAGDGAGVDVVAAAGGSGVDIGIGGGVFGDCVACDGGSGCGDTGGGVSAAGRWAGTERYATTAAAVRWWGAAAVQRRVAAAESGDGSVASGGEPEVDWAGGDLFGVNTGDAGAGADCVFAVGAEVYGSEWGGARGVVGDNVSGRKGPVERELCRAFFYAPRCPRYFLTTDSREARVSWAAVAQVNIWARRRPRYLSWRRYSASSRRPPMASPMASASS